MVISFLHQVWRWVSAFTHQRNEKLLNAAYRHPLFAFLRNDHLLPSLQHPPLFLQHQELVVVHLSHLSQRVIALFSHSIGEQFLTDYDVHELPGASTVTESDKNIVNTGVLARIEYLECISSVLSISRLN